MFRLSPERLRTFRRCRLRYRYQYVDRRPGRASPQDMLGAVIHAALHDFFRYVPPSERDEERLITVLDEKWQALTEPPSDQRIDFVAVQLSPGGRLLAIEHIEGAVSQREPI